MLFRTESVSGDHNDSDRTVAKTHMARASELHHPSTYEPPEMDVVAIRISDAGADTRSSASTGYGKRKRRRAIRNVDRWRDESV